VEKIAFLPLGADFNTAVYRITTSNQKNYFLKLRSGEFLEASVSVPKYLADLGIKQVIPPRKIKRFLGCLEYSFEPGHSSICHNHEYNFIFEAKSESLKIEKQIPQLEAHIELIWVPFHQLSEIDFRAEPLRELVLQWLKTPASDVFRSVMI
jgi:hypothetical protein